MEPTQILSLIRQSSDFNTKNDGPSDYIKNLVENLYIEGLDPPGVRSKMSNKTSPVFRRQAPHDKRRFTGPKIYSNDMNDCCKHKCLLCNKVYTLTAMRGHCKMTHQMSIKEYQYRYGNVRDMIEVVTWHKCLICKADFLLDSDEIHKHASIRHKMSLRQYTQQFLVLKNRGYTKRSNTESINTLKLQDSPLKFKQEMFSV